jgi:hypothetical protein
MGCNCGGKGNVAYQVRFKDGSSQTYATLAEAQAVLGRMRDRAGATIKAVPK